MRAVALGLGCLLSGSLLGGCDALWMVYISTYDMSQAPDLAAVDLSVVDLAVADLAAADLNVPPDLLPPPPPFCDPNDSTLALCLTFEGQVADSSKNTVPVTNSGKAASFVTGPVGQAAHFTTATGVYKLADSMALDVGDYTFETWVQPDSQSASPAKRMGLLDRNADIGVFLYNDTPASKSMILACSVPGGFAMALQIPLNKFSHIACTVGGTQANLYLNGEPVGMQMITAPVKATVRETANFGSNDPDGDDQLVGSLDELRLFAKVRTGAEIRAAYQRGKPPQ